MPEIIYMPIGVIRSPFKDTKGTPIQTAGARGVPGTVETEPRYDDGLKDLQGYFLI